MDIQKIESDLGFQAWLSQEAAVPSVISIDMAWEGGASQDPSGKEGLASFLAAMLTEGSADMDAQAFHKKLADLGAQISCDATSDYVFCRVRMLAHTKTAVFQLLASMFKRPRFDEEAFARVKSQFHSHIRSNLEDPEWLANEAFYSAAFGNHPYARSTDGTHASIDALTIGDLKKYFYGVLARDNLKIAIVGPIDQKESKSFLQDVFGQLPERAQIKKVPEVVWHTGAKKQVPIRNPQTVCVFGMPAPTLHSKDYMPAFVLNYILGGGGFSSRIMQEVREKRGLAYSPYTMLLHKLHMSAFIGSVGTKKESIKESTSVIESVVKELREHGPNEKELDNAKKAITGAYGLKFNSNQKKSAFLLLLQINKFPPEYVEQFPSLVNGVDAKDVHRLASVYFKNPMVVACAGTP